MSNNRFGWIPDLPDPRDQQTVLPMMADLPSSVDLRSLFPTPYTQGSIGSCTAQAVAGLIEFDEQIQSKPNPIGTPSRLFIYYNARLQHGSVNQDTGASMRKTMKALNLYGYPEESYWPYDTTKWKLKPNRAAYRRAYEWRIVQYSQLNQTLTELKTALVAQKPFVFGFSAFAAFESDAVRISGILSLPARNEAMLGGHAALAVGYDDGQSAFLIRNSWGPSWGIGGHFWMPYDYLINSRLSADFWVIDLVP